MTGEAAKKKKNVELTLYRDKQKETLGEEDVLYEGRLLGLVDNVGFNILARQKEAVTKVFTGEGLEVKDLPRTAAGLSGKRIVLVVKKKDSQDKRFVGRTLFITEPLDIISYIGGYKKYMGLITKSGSYILVKDKEEGESK